MPTWSAEATGLNRNSRRQSWRAFHLERAVESRSFDEKARSVSETVCTYIPRHHICGAKTNFRVILVYLA